MKCGAISWRLSTRRCGCIPESFQEWRARDSRHALSSGSARAASSSSVMSTTRNVHEHVHGDSARRIRHVLLTTRTWRKLDGNAERRAMIRRSGTKAKAKCLFHATPLRCNKYRRSLTRRRETLCLLDISSSAEMVDREDG